MSKISENFTEEYDTKVALNKINREIYGHSYTRRLLIKRMLRDLKSYIYLLKSFRFKDAASLFYTRTIVPTGEGTTQWFNRFGLRESIIKYPEKVPLPKFFEIETTTICNKQCIICEYIYWPKGEQVRRHMSLEEFKHIVNQFPAIKWINMTGEGSSFLNKDYFLMLKYLKKKYHTSIWLVDHLSDIEPTQLEKDVLPYIDGIYISMDGATKETYEYIKKGCNFENVINNIKFLIEFKRKNKTPFPHLQFRYIITKQNVNEMPLFLDLLNSIAKPWEWGAAAMPLEFTGLLCFPEIEKYYVPTIPRSVVNEMLKRKGGIEFSFSHAEEKSNPPIDQCIAWMEPYIMMPGYVLPCCAVMMSNRRPFLRKYSFGNVFEKNFKEIWESDYYSKFRKMVVDPCAPVPKICAGCRAFRTQHRIKEYGIWDIHKQEGMQ